MSESPLREDEDEMRKYLDELFVHFHSCVDEGVRGNKEMVVVVSDDHDVRMFSVNSDRGSSAMLLMTALEALHQGRTNRTLN